MNLKNEKEKIKWKDLLINNYTFTKLLKLEKFLELKSSKLNAIAGIYNSNINHFKFTNDPINPNKIPIHNNLFNLVCSTDLLRISRF